MRNILTILKRELRAYFNSAIAYIFIIVFLLISVGLFMTDFFLISIADMRRFFYSLPVILCVFLPAVTMRLWAEDRKGNTLELLLTFPVKTHELVLGKFFASLIFYVAALISTIPVPLMLIFLGQPDVGAIICQYIGAVFLGSFFLALGILVSGFCKDQIVSLILAMMACFVFFLLGTDFTAGSIDGWMPGLGSFLKSSLGLAHHFAAFQKGVMDSRDVLYFLIGTVIFLLLNGFWLETRLRPKARTIFTATCLISLGIFILANFVFSDIPIGRYDFTQDKIYTVSPASIKILQKLKAPVTAKLFISPADKMPTGMKTIERDIRDKLDEFQVAAKGKFNYKVFHMEAANVEKEDEDTLEKSIGEKGIRPFQVRSVEADEVGVKLIYSSLSLAYKEKPEEIIPQIINQNLPDLEYIVISKIYKMTLERMPHVALVAPYVERVVDPQMKQILQQLGQGIAEKYIDDEYELVPKLLEYEGYRVSRIKLTEDESIPEDVDTLVVLEPEKLNERQRFEINNFLVNGGSVFLAVQNYDFQYRTLGPKGLQVSAIDKRPQINQLLQNWGVTVDEDFLMDSQCDVVSLTGEKLLGIFSVSSPVKLPIQIIIGSEQMNKDISITSRLPIVFYLWGTALNLEEKKLKELNLDAKTLLTSSADAWKVKFHSGNLNKADLDMPAAQKRDVFPLAVMLQGQFPDAFKGKEVPQWPPEEEEGEESYEQPEEEIELEPQSGKLILIGCAQTFNRDLFDKGGQVLFFLNSIDALTLGEDLVHVRSKQPIDRSLKKVSAAAKAGWRLATTFLVPVVLSAIGSLRIFIRKRSKWVYLKTV
ncbi:MAG: Gldg family protein [Candidatus Omnitrophica bacterium]|nr:Gldg family protein [Candidatus Omnitrophota bacterium]